MQQYMIGNYLKMNNFEILKTKYSLIEKYWDLMFEEGVDPYLILSMRNNEVKVNILVKSEHLKKIWYEYRSDELPLLDKLINYAKFTIIDVTSLAKDKDSVRFYQFYKDWYNKTLLFSLYPCADLPILQRENTQGIGFYSDSDNYKYYYNDLNVSKKNLYNNQGFVSQTIEKIVPMANQKALETFNLLDAGLDISRISSVERADDSGVTYLVFRS